MQSNKKNLKNLTFAGRREESIWEICLEYKIIQINKLSLFPFSLTMLGVVRESPLKDFHNRLPFSKLTKIFFLARACDKRLEICLRH